LGRSLGDASTERKDRTRFLIEMARGALHNPTMIGKPLPCMELNEYMSTAVELFLCGCGNQFALP